MVTLETVRHVAQLARLELTDSEVKKYQADINNILEAFKVLDETDPHIKNVQPSFQPLPIKDALREDVPEKSLPREKALSNTRHKEKGFFKGPKAV